MGGDEVRIDISDTGAGIAPEHLGRIFERFYRVDKARSRYSSGTGLGLSLVRHVLERSGGGMSVESQLGVGSTFTLVLPRARWLASTRPTNGASHALSLPRNPCWQEGPQVARRPGRLQLETGA